MTWFGWLNDNWFTLLQSISLATGFAFAVIAIKENTKASRLQNLFTLTDQHREIWSLFVVNPRLSRILDPKADLSGTPVTFEEEMFVTMLVIHLTNSHAAQKANLFPGHENLAGDIQAFFALPIPREIWSRLKPLQDENFVKFVEAAVRVR